MPSSEFSPNNVWGSATPLGGEEELTTPRGQTCRARKMSIEDMIKAGVLMEADALTAQIKKYTKKVKKGKPSGQGAPSYSSEIDEKKLLEDPSAITSLIGMIDKALPHIVVSPKVALHYTSQTVGKTRVTKLIPPEERDQNLVYTDQIDFEDKMFLFDWAAGGLSAMLQFRN